MVNLQIGQTAYAVTSVGKKKFNVISGTVVKVPTANSNYLDVEFERKNLFTGLRDVEKQSLWLNRAQVTNNDQPWRPTEREAIIYMRDKKIAGAKRMKKAMETVEIHIALLNDALKE